MVKKFKVLFILMIILSCLHLLASNLEHAITNKNETIATRRIFSITNKAMKLVTNHEIFQSPDTLEFEGGYQLFRYDDGNMKLWFNNQVYELKKNGSPKIINKQILDKIKELKTNLNNNLNKLNKDNQINLLESKIDFINYKIDSLNIIYDSLLTSISDALNTTNIESDRISMQLQRLFSPESEIQTHLTEIQLNYSKFETHIDSTITANVNTLSQVIKNNCEKCDTEIVDYSHYYKDSRISIDLGYGFLLPIGYPDSKQDLWTGGINFWLGKKDNNCIKKNNIYSSIKLWWYNSDSTVWGNSITFNLRPIRLKNPEFYVDFGIGGYFDFVTITKSLETNEFFIPKYFKFLIPIKMSVLIFDSNWGNWFIIGTMNNKLMPSKSNNIDKYSLSFEIGVKFAFIK